MKFIVFFTFLIFSLPSLGTTIWVKSNKESTEYLVIYSIQEKWVIDRFLEVQGDYQDRVGHFIFNNKSEAETKLKKLSKGFVKRSAGFQCVHHLKFVSL